MQTFELIPYPADNIPNIDITGKLTRSDNTFFIHYEVDGEIEQIYLPAKSPSPSRKDDLWKATCFEFFAAIPDQPEYWEFNLSPSGDWNVYKMDAYRRVGFREERAYTELPFGFSASEHKLSLEISLDLGLLFQSEQIIQVGITAIIQTKDGNEAYWALKHASPHADFHARETFILSI